MNRLIITFLLTCFFLGACDKQASQETLKREPQTSYGQAVSKARQAADESSKRMQEELEQAEIN